MNRGVAACVCIAAMVAASPAGTISGTLTSAQTGKGLANAAVTVAGTPYRTLTDSAGSYRFDSVPAASYNLMFFLAGYDSLVVNDVYVSGDAEKRCDAGLSPRATAVDRMVVRGTSFRRPPDMTSSTKVITADELLRAPGALLDVQRVVTMLPSVTSGGDNTNEIVVRGGEPGENLFLLDNIEIPNPNHFGEQGTGGGVISLINTLLVRGLTFNAGAPPAQYGGKASSVLDVTMRDGNSAIVLGGLDLGVAGAGVHVEGPLFSRQTNFMFSATKSYLDFVEHTALNNQAAALPEYWGLETRVANNTADHKIYADGIYGNSAITIDSSDVYYGTKGSTISSGGSVYAGGVTWDQFVTKRWSTSVTLSAVGNSYDRLEYTGADTFFKNTSVEQEQECKARASLDFDNANRLTVGVFVKRADFSIDSWNKPDTLRRYAGASDTPGTVVDGAGSEPVVWQQSVAERDIGYKYGGFVSGIVKPTDRLRVVPGVRLDAFSITHSVCISPRLSAAWALVPELEATCALGVQYQDPDYSALAASAFNKRLSPKKAETAVVGLEYQLASMGMKCTGEGFYKQYSGITVDSSLLRTRGTALDTFATTNNLLSIGKGRSYGLELFAQKNLTHEVSWSLAYSLSKSEDMDPRPGHEGQWYRADFDFTNSLALTGGWKKELLGYAWYKALRNHLWFKILSPVMPLADRNEISFKWRYLGPRPHTSPVYDSTYQRWYVDNRAPLNADVYGEYHSLDIRWERRFGFGFVQMMYYFDLQNVYGRKNIWTRLYTDGRPSPADVYQLPFFPAGGIIIGF
jgi:Carboxypeptidase regulatory-like domain/TonB-dependent Receptor Plug Domain